MFHSPKPHLARLFAVAAIALASLVAAAPVSAKEWVPGKYLDQAMSRVMESVRKVTDKTQYGLDDQSSCFIGAYLEEGKQVGAATIPLTGGTEYAFIGGGDDDVQDMDLYLLDADGDVVAKDDAKDSNPVVVFTPKEDGKYKVVMKLVDGKARGSFVAYALLRKGGYDVPAKNLKAAWERLLGMCEKINDKLGWAAFHDGDNELCVIGSIMKEGETLTQGGIDLEDRPYAFVGAADGQANDIDITVTDGDNEVLAKDTENDAIPLVLYTKGGTVKLKLSDVKSNGATLCMAAVVKLKSK